jgi:3-oxoacyl-[acyl-carrier-protein] synthase-3
MTGMYVHSLAYALGTQRQSVEDAASQGLLVSEAKALREAGFAFHHMAAPSSTAWELARHALEPMGDRLGDAAAIVYATCLPDNANLAPRTTFSGSRDVKHLMDFPASRLQAEFCSPNAIPIGLTQQACTGMLGSLRLAQCLLAAEPTWESALCVTADRFPEGALYEQGYNLISDGAAACLVSRRPEGFRILACHHLANGAYAQASDDETAGSFFSYTWRAIQETLAKAGLGIQDITWIVPQNMNVKAWQILARHLGVPAERVHCPSLAAVGHVISGDCLINLKDLQDGGGMGPGERVLLVMAGFGLNWQCVLLERV